MDSDLALALELSAKEARESAKAPLLLSREGANDGSESSRESRQPPLAQHFGSRQNRVARGCIVSRGALNQFSPHWNSLIDKYDTAGSICGYVTAANVEILCRAAATLRHHSLKKQSLTTDEVEFLLESVRDSDAVTPLIEIAMQRVRKCRGQWVDEHANSFPGGHSGAEARKFFRGWVANYELSDLLAQDAQVAAHGVNDTTESEESESFAQIKSAPVQRHFLRYNQYFEIDDATEDERERILKDEACFGGVRNPDGTVTFREGESVFFMERFDCISPQGKVERRLQTPEQWAKLEEVAPTAAATASSANLPVKVFAVDLNGHYSAALACKVEDQDAREVRNILFLVNSTCNVYASEPSMTWLYDTVFPPHEGAVATAMMPLREELSPPQSLASQPQSLPEGVAQQRSAVLSFPAEWQATLAVLTEEMGFREDQAKEALLKASGSKRDAVFLLLAL